MDYNSRIVELKCPNKRQKRSISECSRLKSKPIIKPNENTHHVAAMSCYLSNRNELLDALKSIYSSVLLSTFTPNVVNSPEVVAEVVSYDNIKPMNPTLAIGKRHIPAFIDQETCHNNPIKDPI